MYCQSSCPVPGLSATTPRLPPATLMILPLAMSGVERKYSSTPKSAGIMYCHAICSELKFAAVI